MAVDGGDGRDFGAHEGLGDALDAAAVVGAGAIGLVLRPDAGARLHGLQIAAGGKGVAGAGQDEAGNTAVGADAFDGGNQRITFLQRADGIHRRG